jgi:hypothetical protein
VAELAPRCARIVLRRLRDVGGSHRSDLEVRHDGKGAIRISGVIALCVDREPPGRDHDADCIRIRIHPRKPQQDFTPSEDERDLFNVLERRGGEG